MNLPKFTTVPEVLAYMTQQEEGTVRSARAFDFALEEHATLGEVINESLQGLVDTGSDSHYGGLEDEVMDPGTYEAILVVKIVRTGDALVFPKDGMVN